MKAEKRPSAAVSNPSLFGLLRPYIFFVSMLILLAILSNGLNLLLPQITSRAIDSFLKGSINFKLIVLQFISVSFLIFVFSYFQSIVQTFASERVARDLREKLSNKISKQSYAFIQKVTPAKLLTNLTSDVDSVKTFVSQAIVSIISSIFLIVGSSVLLLLLNWRLAVAVLLIIPVIGITFFTVLAKVRVLFKKSREVIDWLNRVINESILGAALIRVLNSQQPEYEKFLAANTDAKDLGLQVLRLFAALIPIITFVANIATLTILTLGGHFVIAGTMTLGNFTAFTSYLAILIFPILIIGFMSNVIAQAQASYQRIGEVLVAEEKKEEGKLTVNLRGDIDLTNIGVNYGQKPVLKNVTFSVKAGTKIAIIGPTAAGKTQLLYMLTGLIQPSSGKIEYDQKNINDYETVNLHRQIGFVFQDSIIFNLSLLENIAFNQSVKKEDLEKAIQTAELTDYIDSLPDQLNTIVSERGASLSGGQKQRIMLARALALNPRILLLDDFTARVDTNTEQKILKNIANNYPGLTLLSVTQKISSVELYDQIILLMEGEVLAIGKHQELLKKSSEYVQIYNSQRSTSHYEELHT